MIDLGSSWKRKYTSSFRLTGVFTGQMIKVNLLNILNSLNFNPFSFTVQIRFVPVDSNLQLLDYLTMMDLEISVS